MPTETPPRIVAVTAGAPFDPRSRSGTSLHLFTALRRTGSLAGVVNGRPSWVAWLERAGAWSPDRELRTQRAEAYATRTSPLARRVMSRIGGARARDVDARPDALLQIGAWYDLTRTPGLAPRLRVNYQDGNLAAFLARPDLRLDRGSRAVRRALAWEARVYRGLDLLLPRSEWLRRSFIEDFGIPADRVVAVGAGANFATPPDPPARNWEEPRLLFVGKNFTRKGGPQVLEAFASLRRSLPRAELWIVGPSEPPSPAPGVRFFGRISRAEPAGEEAIRKLYREATLFVMPSLFEAWGIAFLEAMAWALPCVGARACAMPEIVEEGATGLLVPPADAGALRGALAAIASDPGMARAMGEAGRRRFLERFTWDRVASRIVVEISRRLG